LARNNLGVVYVQLKEFEKAKGEFEKALDIDRGDRMAVKNLATLERMMQSLKKG